ncbi:MAG: NAD(P)-dependent oxidoreductase [Alphaproteobacteria bacterium]|jgi:3-hydroxyisobutyrate dehydrogenase|nr:NAD(P)-dependent oxidoreductase [Alphaproteobacteria bacterium]
MAANTYGFIGLGNMGSPMCANLIGAGLSVQVFDAADTAVLAPEGSAIAASVGALVSEADTIFLSLPDGKVVHAVCAEIAAASSRQVTTVVDFSTTGPEAAARASEMLAEAGITFVDAPVSGGKAGAVAGSLTVIVSGPDKAVEDLAVPFGAVGGNIFLVGPNPGQAQAVKLLNNFLSATAMAATSEAVVFGQKHGVDMSTILDVVNVSTGRNTATMDKFPNRVVPGTFDAGFAMALMTKDVALYLEQVGVAGTPDAVGSIMSALWNAAHDDMPGSDFTEIYRYIAGEK